MLPSIATVGHLSTSITPGVVGSWWCLGESLENSGPPPRALPVARRHDPYSQLDVLASDPVYFDSGAEIDAALAGAERIMSTFLHVSVPRYNCLVTIEDARRLSGRMDALKFADRPHALSLEDIMERDRAGSNFGDLLTEVDAGCSPGNNPYAGIARTGRGSWTGTTAKEALMSWSLSIPKTPRDEFDAAVDAVTVTQAFSGDGEARRIGANRLEDDVTTAKEVLKSLALRTDAPYLTASAGGHALSPGEEKSFHNSFSVTVGSVYEQT